MVGIPGAGKTHFAKHFAKTFNAPFLNHHVIADLSSSSEQKSGELSSLLLDEIMKTQRTVVLEAPLGARKARQSVAKKTKAAGYTTLFVWVQTDSDEARRRSTKRGGRHDKASFEESVRSFQPMHSSESFIVISGKHTFATQVKSVLRHLAEPRPASTPKPRPGVQNNRNIVVR
jgi:predicted kinase